MWNPLHPAIRPTVLAALLLAGPLAPAGGQEEPRALKTDPRPLIIDGRLEELWGEGHPWQREEVGIPEELGGRVYLLLRGNELDVGAFCPEPDGRVLAYSVGQNPVWEKDSLDLPPVEDRVRIELEQEGRDSPVQFSLEVNPWGAYRMEVNGQVSSLALPVAASVDSRGWRMEAAIPFRALTGSDGPPGRLRFRARRIRARRPLAPEFHWSWPSPGSWARLELPSPGDLPPAPPSRFDPPLWGNPDPPVEIARAARPSLEPLWEAPPWNRIPARELRRSEPFPRKPVFPTRVKWVQDGTTLALLIRCDEPEPLVADQGGRDASVSRDDHAAIYLATSGSSFLEILVNPAGTLRDALAVGPHPLRPRPEINLPIRRQTEIAYGAWTVRIDLPLEECARALGEETLPTEWRILVARQRAPRPGDPDEVSSFPSVTPSRFSTPLHYQRVRLSSKTPAELSEAPVPGAGSELSGLAAELVRTESNAWPAETRRYLGIRQMLDRHGRRRVEEAVWKEREAWSLVTDRAGWEEYRKPRWNALRRAVGTLPAAPPPLDLRVRDRF